MKKSSLLLAFMLTLSMTACIEKGDPVLSRFSKVENVPVEEAIVDFSKKAYSLRGKTIDDFDIEKYANVSEPDDSFESYETYLTVFGHPNTRILLMLKNNEFSSLSIFLSGSFTSEETEPIRTILDSKLKPDGMVYRIQDDMVLLFLDGYSHCSFHYTIVPPKE